MATRILTWNLQGRARPDLAAVADVLGALTPDVVALQEVQRGQARELAARLGWSLVWRCKHWPLVVAPEGLALLTPRPAGGVATVHLAHRFRWWSWRRRIALRADVTGPEGVLGLVVTHLGAGVGDDERSRQAARCVAALGAPDGGAAGCVVGDLNTHPGSVVLSVFAAAGLRDAWIDARPGEAGPTNWSPGPRDGAPTQRLDYALVGEGLEVTSMHLPAAGEPGFTRYGALSDHLPLVVGVVPRSGPRRPASS